MTQRKSSSKRPFRFKDMPILKSKKTARSYEHRPEAFFRSHKKVAEALLQSLEDDDAGGFLEILDTYLQINRHETAT